MQIVKVILLTASILTLLLLAVGLSDGLTKTMFVHASYFIIFTLFISWVLRMVSVYGKQWKAGIKLHWPALTLALVIISFIFLISPPRFKVLTDETNLIGVSMMMYANKTAEVPLEGIHTDFESPKLRTLVDRRPVFFPFLVSLIHSVIGYSPSNGFILNFFLGWALLFVMYLSVSKVLNRTYGRLSMLMVASAPIFVVYVTSSGFEVLNALFLILSFLLLMETFDREDEPKINELLLLTLLLLAQCRYESSIILPLFLIIMLPLFWRQKVHRKLSFLHCLMPLFLLPVAWQRLLYSDVSHLNKITYNVYYKVTSAFGLKNLVQHVDDNFFVLLGIDPNWGFSIILACLAIVGAYLMGKNLVLQKEIYLKVPVFLAGLASFTLLLGIISAFFWGKFTITANNRLALVFLPFVVWMAVYGVYRIGRHFKIEPNEYLTLLFVFHLLFFWPIGAAQRVANGMALPYEYRRALAYLHDNYPNRNNTLVLAEMPNMYIIHKYSAYRIASIDKMLNTLPNSTIEQVIALQTFVRKSGDIKASSRLKDPIETTKVRQFKISPDLGLKISECHIRNNLSEEEMPKSDTAP